MKQYRLNRLFHPRSNRCFDVAIDHGFFNERGFLAGIENLDKAVRTVVAAAPDAVQLTVGQAHYLQSLPGKDKPALVLRTDVANVYGNQLPRALFSRMIEAPVEQALRLDATCVVVNLFRIPGEPEVTDQCILNILRIKPECDRYAMPLMIEPLVFQPNAKAGGSAGCRTRCRHHQGGPHRRCLGLPPRRRDIGAHSRSGARRREGAGRGDPLADRSPDAARCRRNCLRPQYHPAREPSRDDTSLDGRGA
jgi:hypothetical protein